MKVELVTASTYNIPDLNKIKDHLGLERGWTEQDDLLKGLRLTALEYAQNYTNRKLRAETWKLYLDDWPYCESVELPYAPLRSIPSTGVVYTDSDGNSTTLSSTKWSADTVSEPGRLVLNYDEIWPTNTLANKNPIAIEFNAGYESSSSVPESIKIAMLLMMAQWYEGREDAIVGAGILYAKMPLGAKALMSPYRNFKF